jgi:O-antigen ligase
MKIFEKITIWPLILSPLVVFFSFNDSFYPYIASKVLLWGLLITISSIGIIGLSLSSSEYRDQFYKRTVAVFKNKFFLATLLILCSMIMSALTAYESLVAWVGSFVRWEGVTFFILLQIYLFYLLVLFNKKEWKYFSQINLLSFVGIFLATMIQGLSLILTDTRPDVFIGNPIFSAQYFLLAGGFLLLYFISNNKKKYLIPIIIGIFLGVVITQSRGVIVGVVVAMLFALGYFLSRPKSQEKIINTETRIVRKKIIMLFVLLAVFPIIFFCTRSIGVWSNVPIVKRFAGQELFGKTTESRIITITTSLNSINPKNEGVKRLFFGWGNENYQFAWSKYYKQEIYKFDKAPFDRAHNKYLDILVMQGIVGLVAYILYLLFFIKQAHSLGGLAAIAGIAIVVGYAVQNLFAFESFTSYLYLAIIAAYVLSLNANE